jgi:photosystem II stability/assembly factor-like uncharacterized protein
MARRLTIILLALAWLLAACETDPVAIETDPADKLPAATFASTPATQPATQAPSSQEVPAPEPSETALPPEQDGLVVWAATESTLLRSLDGGQSWDEITPPGLDEALAIAGEGMPAMVKAAFSGENFGLAAISQPNQALIYRTKDGGESWEESVLIYEEEVQGIVSLATLGDDLAWLLVTRGLGAGNDWVDLYHSQDGGASWSYLAWSSTEADPYGSIPSGGLKTGIAFNSPQKGWITGSAPIDFVYLFRSLDGGQTWQDYHLALPEGVAVAGASSPPQFFDEQNGVLDAGVYTITDQPGLLFFWTQDGGDSWQPAQVLEGRFTAIDWADRQHGFAVEANDFNQTRLFATQDGGATWEAFPIELPVVSRIEFITDQVGWAICGWKDAPGQGCAGELYRTLDGGQSWEIVTP